MKQSNQADLSEAFLGYENAVSFLINKDAVTGYIYTMLCLIFDLLFVRLQI